MGDAPQHHEAYVGGVRLHWIHLRCPDAAGVPLVLLHGLLDSHHTWKYVDAVLAQGREVLLLDLPGHGESERPDASYELRWYASVVAQWLVLLGYDQVDVVGHSFGGGVAQILLLECPERIRRLGLVATGGLGREISWVLRLAAVPFVIEHLGQPFMGLGTRLTLWGQRGFTHADIAELAAINSQPGAARALGRTIRDIIDWRGQRQVFFDRAHEIREMPRVGIFWGDHDRLIPIAHGRRLADFLEGAVFVSFSGCGHYPHHEAPELFVQAVCAFLDAVP